MGRPVAIMGTSSDHGGQMISASGSHLMTSGGAACLVTDTHSCPIPEHGNTNITSNASVKATVHGLAIALQGSVAGCGATLTSNFANKITLT